MAWIEVPDWSRGTEAMRAMYERFKNRGGGMDNILAVHGLHPAGLEGHHALYREVMFAAGPLSRRDRELVATAVSAENGCRY